MNFNLIKHILWRYKRIKSLTEFEQKIFKSLGSSAISNFEDSASAIVEIVLYDILNNDGFAKLIKRLYRLKKRDSLTVDTHYIKRGLIKIDYVRPQFDYTSTVNIGNIEFKSDSIIKEINICGTQINNEEMLLEYTFKFKKLLWDDNQIAEYVKSNIKNLASLNYVPVYNQIDDLDDGMHQEVVMQFFYAILQRYIVRDLFSNIGKLYVLPRLTKTLYKEHSAEIDEYLKDPFPGFTYKSINKDQYYVLERSNEFSGVAISEYIFGHIWQSESMLQLFSGFKMEAYLTLFYNIEKHMLEVKITKFLNSKRRLFNSKDYKWLMGRARKVEEECMYEFKSIDSHNLRGYSKDCNEPFLRQNYYTDKFRKIYRDNLSYLSRVQNANYNTLLLFVTVATLILTAYEILHP